MLGNAGGRGGHRFGWRGSGWLRDFSKTSMAWKTKGYYQAAKKTQLGGETYDSRFESKVAQDLTFREMAKELIRWERQVKIPLIVNGYQIAEYVIDFVAYRTDGVVEYIEAKGWPTPLWRMKWAIFEALYKDRPGIELRIVWQREPRQMRKLKKV